MPQHHITHPCGKCPFRTDTQPGWLGRERMTEICNAPTFTCHKTHDPNRKQCAGHMLLLGDQNQFVQVAERFGFDLGLTGRDKVFDTVGDAVEHHSN